MRKERVWGRDVHEYLWEMCERLVCPPKSWNLAGESGQTLAVLSVWVLRTVLTSEQVNLDSGREVCTQSPEAS